MRKRLPQGSRFSMRICLRPVWRAYMRTENSLPLRGRWRREAVTEGVKLPQSLTLFVPASPLPRRSALLPTAEVSTGHPRPRRGSHTCRQGCIALRIVDFSAVGADDLAALIQWVMAEPFLTSCFFTLTSYLNTAVPLRPKYNCSPSLFKMKIYKNIFLSCINPSVLI